MSTDLQKINKIQPEQYARPELDSLNFRDAVPLIKRNQEILMALSQIPSASLTREEKRDNASLSRTLIDVLSRVSSFIRGDDETKSAAEARRATLLDELENITNSVKSKLLPVLGLRSSASVADLESLKVRWENELSSRIRTADERTNHLNNSLREIESKKPTLDQAIRDAQNLVGTYQGEITKKTASDYSVIFSAQANRHKEVAIYLMFLFFVSLVPIALVLAGWINDPPEIKDKIALLEFLVIRLSVAALTFVVSWQLLKNFNINFELYNLNRHRANSLDSAKALLGVAESLSHDVKSKMIEDISTTVFTYNRTQGGRNATITTEQLIEIAKLLKP